MPILGRLGSKFGFGSTRAKIYASGGSIVLSGDDVYHVFTSPGTFKIEERILSQVEYFIVSGGGGSGNPGGGGGGGGVSTGTATVTDNPGSYTITVGSGGVYTQPSAPTRNGSSSSAFSITQPGGGGGGTTGTFTDGPQNGFAGAPGANGGGGGGAYVFCGSPPLTFASGGSAGTGPFNGGSGSPATVDGCGSSRSSGGGGGEGGAGSSGTPNSTTPRPGGAGVSSPASFPIPDISSVMPASWKTTIDESGFGYGGDGSPDTRVAGVDNTGGGGTEANGGSGIVIVKYTTRKS